MANSDNRYDRVFTDPKFWVVPKAQKRVKIDKRFAEMFSDERFGSRSAPVDKRGRPSELIKWSDSSKSGGAKYRSDLEKFYEVADVSAESSTERNEIIEENAVVATKSNKQAIETNKPKRKTKQQIKRKKRNGTKRSQPEIDEPTSRIAICNQDWDRLRAIDLFMLFRSFIPPNCQEDAVRRVCIYQSAYGAKRQAADDQKGPRELRQATQTSDHSSAEGSDVEVRESLVKYQRNRLKYCYAIAQFDSAETAMSLYQQLDGIEYEASCTRLDLRFVPEGEGFDECKVMSAVDSEQIKSGEITYEPPASFVTTALGQTDVKLTWEEKQTPERKRAFQALLSVDSDMEESKVCGQDVNNFIAPPSEDEDNREDDRSSVIESVQDSEVSDAGKYSKYRALLLEADTEDQLSADDGAHMEVTWDPGLTGPGVKSADKEDDQVSVSDKDIALTKNQKKQKVKRQARAALSTQDKLPNDAAAFGIMFGPKETRPDQGIQIEGTKDPRFASLLTRPEYHIDTTQTSVKQKGKKRNKNSQKN